MDPSLSVVEHVWRLVHEAFAGDAGPAGALHKLDRVGRRHVDAP